MKRAINIVLILWFSASFAQEKQEIFSVYFHVSAFDDLTPVPNVRSTYFKKYNLKATEANEIRNAAGEYLIVDATGIYLEKNKLLFITREQVRENSKYEMRDGYLFGVIKNDSVLTALDDEKYYFLVPTKTYLFQAGVGSSTIYQGLTTDEYLVVTPEPNEHFSCIYFRFKGGALDIAELNFDRAGCSLDNVKEKETITGDFNTYILTPTLVEWKLLYACFSAYDQYVLTN